jgi:ketosteroid isomerase-like protein
MSRENVVIVRNAYDAFNRRDWDALFRDSHADFEMTTQRGPDAGTRRGRERVTEFAEDYIAAFDELIWDPEEFFEGGDQVVVFVTIRARPRGGSVDLVIRNGHCWTVRDGAIVSMKTFPEPERALEAAGLRE